MAVKHTVGTDWWTETRTPARESGREGDSTRHGHCWPGASREATVPKGPWGSGSTFEEAQIRKHNTFLHSVLKSPEPGGNVSVLCEQVGAIRKQTQSLSVAGNLEATAIRRRLRLHKAETKVGEHSRPAALGTFVAVRSLPRSLFRVAGD